MVLSSHASTHVGLYRRNVRVEFFVSNLQSSIASLNYMTGLMDYARQRWILRTACPLGAIISILVTMVLCFIMVKVDHIWVSGLSWPFLSDMGRDPPPYYVFTTGLTLVAIMLVFTWTFNWRYQVSALPEDATVFRLISLISFIAGVIANAGLPVLVRENKDAFFDTPKHAEVHLAGAECFFYIETIAVFLNTIVSYKLYKMLTGLQTDLQNTCSTIGAKVQRRKKTPIIQVIFFSLFFMAFLIYMPIGLAVTPELQRLSVSDCIDKGLGENYCELACILTLVGYSASFITNDYDEAYDPVLDRSR
ncbi:hypothetical protein PsorP6_005882 [Peronosclerospora sorghi]|uniref:Uncharacterized protein n=1 Tax=Peronosclerospora sorghi TaxID=230839 RepID=A0ACC0W3H3_9STRA|nr:hypothetical protein PsorP6_005882 [Peronosclerospora sorghi]